MCSHGRNFVLRLLLLLLLVIFMLYPVVDKDGLLDLSDVQAMMQYFSQLQHGGAKDAQYDCTFVCLFASLDRHACTFTVSVCISPTVLISVAVPLC